MYQALYRKWRPKTFADVVGQEHITETLQRQVAEGRLSHAYLFTGTRGTGKTTCAKILARAVNCEHPENGNPCNRCPSCLGIESGRFLDVVELDAASNNGVDSVRALRDEAIYSPAQVKKRVYIVDEVHMLSTPAFNALLKILEEPPEHLMFILATTELHKVPATILSRCQRFSFRRIQPKDIVGRLNYIAQQENIDLKDDGAALLARLSDGALRDALSLLDQCAAVGGAIDAPAVLDALGLAGNVQTAQLMSLILTRDARGALALLGKLYDGGKDVGAVLGELSALSRELLISATAGEGGESLLSGAYDASTLDSLRAQGTSARFIQLCTILQETAAQLQFSINRRTDAELCILKLCDETLSGDLAALGARIARLEEQIAAGVQFAASIPHLHRRAHLLPRRRRHPHRKGRGSAHRERKARRGSAASVGRAARPTTMTHRRPTASRCTRTEGRAPKIAAAPAPAQEAPASGESGDDEIFYQLMESYKNRLTPDKRAFIGMAQGDVKDDLLTVYCSTEVQKSMLDQKVVTDVLSEVTSRAVGREIRVRFLVGERPGAKKRDKMQDLLRMGSKFDNFTVK
ncbi:MAG: DNA polymerase III subunit gamma/tau [Oscillospiraceae bacterium]